MPEIGTTLREARMRQRIDISEVEAETKIRGKYLRAMENEEWNLLPGPAYVKSFLRTYADALGLDGRLLVEEYKLRHERLSDIELQPIAPPRAGSRGRGRGGRAPRRGIPRGWIVAVVVLGLLGALYLLGKDKPSGTAPPVTSAGSTSRSTSTASAASKAKRRPRTRRSPQATAASRIVRLRLVPTGPVYACVLDAGGHRLVNGATLTAGSPTRTFRSRRFRLTLGNGNVRMVVDGRTRTVPQTPAGIGYEVTKGGRRTLAPGRRPNCA